MTLDLWLETRVPVPPPALARRIRQAVHAAPAADGAPLPEVLLAAGEHLLRQLVEGDATTRSAATDLLAADALVTYAFEASASDPHLVLPRAEAAMRRLAALAAEKAP